MKEFFRTLLAVMVGLILFNVIFFVFIFIIIAAAGASSSSAAKPVEVKANTVLKLDFNYNIPEQSQSLDFNSINSLEDIDKKTLGYRDITLVLEKAAKDPKIKGIYMQVSDCPNGMAGIKTLREALLEFKKSGKFIYAYGEVSSQKAYLLASVAHKIYLNPSGYMEIMGFGTRLFFIKNMLDKAGVEVQAFHRGKFKSAFDPLVKTEASPENEKQIYDLLDDMYAYFKESISTDRKLTKDEIATTIDSMRIQMPEDAVQLHWLDGLKYEDEVRDEMAKKAGLKKDKDLQMMSLESYYASNVEDMKETSGDKIAVIYASGDIVDGNSNDPNMIAGGTYAKMISKLRQDDKVKAIVLRINSGGGSALASEVIWRETVLAAKDKPFVVSIGDVAASGGYYIACNATRIFAEPVSITGSIGVFGLIPNFQKLTEEKLGITHDEIRLNPHAVSNAGVQPLNSFESKVIQRNIDSTYSVFLTRVADGRKQTFANIEEKAEGRVWSGIDAKNIGLVDEMGGLDDAIAYAAQKAGLKKYRTVEYPKEMDFFNKLISGTKEDIQTRFLKQSLGDFYNQYKMFQSLSNYKGIQARMPFLIEIE